MHCPFLNGRRGMMGPHSKALENTYVLWFFFPLCLLLTLSKNHGEVNAKNTSLLQIKSKRFPRIGINPETFPRVSVWSFHASSGEDRRPRKEAHFLRLGLDCSSEQNEWRSWCVARRSLAVSLWGVSPIFKEGEDQPHRMAQRGVSAAALLGLKGRKRTQIPPC